METVQVEALKDHDYWQKARKKGDVYPARKIDLQILEGANLAQRYTAPKQTPQVKTSPNLSTGAESNRTRKTRKE